METEEWSVRMRARGYSTQRMKSILHHEPSAPKHFSVFLKLMDKGYRVLFWVLLVITLLLILADVWFFLAKELYSIVLLYLVYTFVLMYKLGRGNIMHALHLMLGAMFLGVAALPFLQGFFQFPLFYVTFGLFVFGFSSLAAHLYDGLLDHEYYRKTGIVYLSLISLFLGLQQFAIEAINQAFELVQSPANVVAFIHFPNMLIVFGIFYVVFVGSFLFMKKSYHGHWILPLVLFVILYLLANVAAPMLSSFLF